MRIHCLGDSLTRGYGVLIGNDYPSQLQKMLRENGYLYYVDNYGVDGQSSEELILCLHGQLRDAKLGDLVLLLIGSNDVLSWRLPVEEYLCNLRRLVEMILAKGLALLIATLPPIEIEFCYGEDPMYRLKKYNHAMREFAQEKGLHIVELAEMDVNLTIDGLHFGNQGYAKMAKYWFEALVKNRMIML